MQGGYVNALLRSKYLLCRVLHITAIKYISNKEGTFFLSEKKYTVFTLTSGEKKNISV